MSSAPAASTSKAKEEGAPLSTIMQAAGWSRQSTFTKFYDKPLIRQVSLADFVLPKSTGSAAQGCLKGIGLSFDMHTGKY